MPVTGCVAVDANTVRCTMSMGEGDSVHAYAELGDGDDAFHGSAFVDGGSGNDRLTGESGWLTGGPGSDVLTATGPVVLGDGDGAEPARDRYIGLASDPATLDYSDRSDDLRIDLRTGTVAPEGDHIENIDSVTGGFGDDVLIGTDGPNAIFGGYGSDRILGLGGDDVLTTGIYTDDVFHESKGREIVEGGAGDDRIEVTSRHGRGSIYRCGAGKDVVAQVQLRDYASVDCEQLVLREARHVRLHPSSNRFLSGNRRGVYVARAGRQVVARGSRDLRLNALGRRLLAERGRLELTVGVLGAHFRTELLR